jgi:hypothetical protein
MLFLVMYSLIVIAAPDAGAALVAGTGLDDATTLADVDAVSVFSVLVADEQPTSRRPTDTVASPTVVTAAMLFIGRLLLRSCC